MKEMKDSGISLIGLIPSTWNVTRNKNVFSCKKDVVGEASSKTQLLSLTTKGIKEKDINNADGKLPESFDTYQIVKQNELVMCLFDLDVSAVFSGISHYDGMISPAYRVLHCKENIIPQFADYWFRYIADGRKFNHYAKNIRYTLNYEDFSTISIVLPPLCVQIKIANYLDDKCARIDAIIEKQQAVIEKLKEYKLAVITEAVTKGLNPNVEKKDSGIDWIGGIPSHWSVVKLGNIFDFLGGYAYNSDLYVSESGNQVIRIGNVKNNHMIFEANPVFISDEVARNTEKFKLKAGTILFTMTGTKGKRDYFYTHLLSEKDMEKHNLFPNQRVGCFIPREKICAGYYNYLLKDNHILDSIFVYETGTANQGNLGIDSIKRTKLHFPPVEEQVEIYEHLENMSRYIAKKIQAKQSIIDKLFEYKKSLIYEVVTGKREV